MVRLKTTRIIIIMKWATKIIDEGKFNVGPAGAERVMGKGRLSGACAGNPRIAASPRPSAPGDLTL